MGQIKRQKYKADLNKNSFIAPESGIYINFGDVLPKEKGAIVHGGKVKLELLKEAYQERESGFNILYLVSSALPEYAEDLILWAKATGAIFVYNQNGVAFPAWAGNSYETKNKLLSQILGMADYVLYQSDFCKESADRYLGSIPCPYEISYNSVNTEYFQIAENKPPIEDGIRIISAGTHQSADRVSVALDAALELKRRGQKFSLKFVGKMDWPNADSEVEEMVDRSDISSYVSFEPPFTRDKALSIFQSAHILLHTKYNDPCPTVVIEAMSCGLPVVATRSGGTEELVGEDGGILLDVLNSWEKVHKPDASLSADAIMEIMKDWNGFSNKARERAERQFNAEKWIDQHKRVFEKLLNKNHSA